jgi:glucuronate isomerase
VLSKDRLFPAEPSVREIARRLDSRVRALPIVSPYGHADPAWFSLDQSCADPPTLRITLDHYLYRMLYCQGVSLDSLGIPRTDGAPSEMGGRASLG